MLEDDRGRWPGGLRCAQHPYSLPFTSHQASLVPTGFHAAEAQTDRVGAGADLIGRLEEELNQLGDASGQEGEALQVGERQEARREWLLGRGGASGQQLYWGWSTLVGVLGGLYGVCCHIISLPNLYDSQTTLGRGLGQRDS